MGNRLVMGCELYCGYGEGVAVVAGKNKEEREFKQQELQQRYRYVVGVGSSNELPPDFDHLQAVANVIHCYHREEQDVKEIIILSDLLTPSGWDMVRLLFPDRELSSDDQGNIVITEDQSSSLLWGQHIIELRWHPTIAEPTAST